MTIFSKKWRYFSIGCISVFILLCLQSWLTILGLFFLVFIHPSSFVVAELNQNKETGLSQKKGFIILVLLPVLSFVTGVMSETKDQNRIERQKEIAIKVKQEEHYRLENALVWDIDTDPSLTEKEKAFVKAAASNLISNEKMCNKLTMGGQSTVNKESYYLQCKTKKGRYFNIYFTEGDIKNRTILKILEPYPEKKVTELCFQRTWNSIKFPDTMEDLSWKKNVSYANGNTKQEETFRAENSYGVPIRYRSVCIVDLNGAVIEFEVTRE